MDTRRLWLALALLGAAAAPALAASSGDTARPRAQAPAPVDVNRAGIAELSALPGIGPKLARRIVAFREEHGPFRKVEELLAVKGIGPRLLERLRDRLTVGRTPPK